MATLYCWGWSRSNWSESDTSAEWHCLMMKEYSKRNSIVPKKSTLNRRRVLAKVVTVRCCVESGKNRLISARRSSWSVNNRGTLVLTSVSDTMVDWLATARSTIGLSLQLKIFAGQNGRLDLQKVSKQCYPNLTKEREKTPEKIDENYYSLLGLSSLAGVGLIWSSLLDKKTYFVMRRVMLKIERLVKSSRERRNDDPTTIKHRYEWLLSFVTVWR